MKDIEKAYKEANDALEELFFIKKENMELKKFEKAYNELIDAFRDKYYSYDDGSKNDIDLGYIGYDERGFMGPIGIGDDYWDMQDIYQALLFDIPKKTLFEYYNYSMDTYNKNEGKSEKEVIMNLYTYIKRGN